MTRILTKFLLIVALSSLASCKIFKANKIDDQVELTRSDFKKYVYKNKERKKGKRASSIKNSNSSIPKMRAFSSRPPRPLSDQEFLDSYQKISFSVTDQIPLKDVLIELGRIAKIDVELDPNISGGIIISAHKKPLGQVVKRICELGNLRYKYRDGVLRFERDIPFLKTYQVDYLNEGSNLWQDVESNLNAILENEKSGSVAMSSVEEDNLPKSSISVSKSAGLITIFANHKQHNKATQYLSNVEKNSSAQVLIEAKVVEVTLNDEFRTGINWSGDSGNFLVGAGFSAAGAEGSTSAISFVTNGDIGLSVSALEKFGTTRTLSSPRIHAINNRKSILNFTREIVYFKIESDVTTAGVANAAGQTVNSVTSTKEVEEEGVKLTITPSINLNTNEVTMKIKPVITVNAGFVDDPARVRDNNGDLIAINVVPQMITREIDTVAKVASGNAIVIGGLMQESTNSEESGVPFLQRIPIIGYLFKSTIKVSQVTETVLFIKATIVDSVTRAGKIDREIQEKFDSNRRRFF